MTSLESKASYAMVEERKSGLMDQIMRENGQMEWHMEKAFFIIQTENTIRESFLRIKQMEEANMFIITDRSMTESGKMTKCMEMAERG